VTAGFAASGKDTSDTEIAHMAERCETVELSDIQVSVPIEAGKFARPASANMK
jgi:hypothetical protein